MATRGRYRTRESRRNLVKRETITISEIQPSPADVPEEPRKSIIWRSVKRGNTMRQIAAAKADHRADRNVPLVRYHPRNDIWLILRGDEANRVPNPELGQWDRRKGMMVGTPAKIGKMKKRRSQKRHSPKFWRYQ